MEYKDTLLMPKTEFPMRGNLPQREPQLQEKWEQENIYEKVMKHNGEKPTFILHDGPPYANGDIHMGHALNKVLKDFIVRYYNMNGYRAPYVPGWDTHGLPIEQALANKKVNRKEMSVADFRKLCEEYAYEQVERQKEQFKRLGILGDWDNPYITLQKDYEAEQIKVFGKMATKGLIYKGLKPVYWSPSSESALAEAEIEYKDKKSASIYVAFTVENGKGLLDGGEKFIIWTTTPWTIPANLAISLNPDLEYSVVHVNNDKFVVASELLNAVKTELEWEDAVVEKTFKGQDLEGVETKHPLYDRKSPIILGDHVTTEAGTGCVHTAPGHGEDDFIVGQKYGLGVLCPVNEKGVLTEEAPGFEGLFYDDANKEITKALEEKNALLKLKFITHSYAHDWRTKKPIIYRATAQWFASIAAIRNELMDAVKNTKWFPAWGETRLFNMVRDRGDWCISRQRVWGVPIPVFYAENGQEIITEETIAHVSELFRKHGSNCWFEMDVNELLPEGFTHPGSPNGTFTKETDIMDVWFDSGSSHQAVLAAREGLSFPADVYLEGSDQYRGWFNSSLSTSVAVTGQAPYKAVVSHGFVLDGEGRKMSKSIGNIVVPSKIMNQYGSDILRLWVSSVDYQSDVRMSDAILKQVAEVYRKIRNTFRFLLGNLDGFNAETDALAFEELRELDQYMLVKLNDVVKNVRQSYENYEFAAVYHAIQNFCTIDLSSFYFDLSKDVLYIEPKENKDRLAIQTVLHEALQALTRLVAPILPHTADEVWSHMSGKTVDSIMLTEMPEVKMYGDTTELVEKWVSFMAVRDDVLKALEIARNEKVIGKSLTAAIKIYPSNEAYELLTSIKEDLNQLLIVSKAEVVTPDTKAPETAQSFEKLSIEVTTATGETCERCWVVTEEVGVDQDHPTLCKRCASVVKNMA
jgi:isoleucyl-tRNA synthetase